MVYLSYPAICLEYRFWLEKSFGLVYIGDFGSLTLENFCAIYGQNINRLLEVRNQLRFHFSKCNRQMIFRNNQESTDENFCLKTKVIGPKIQDAPDGTTSRPKIRGGIQFSLPTAFQRTEKWMKFEWAHMRFTFRFGPNCMLFSSSRLERQVRTQRTALEVWFSAGQWFKLLFNSFRWFN